MEMKPIKFRAWIPAGYGRWKSEKGQMLTWEQVLDDLHSELNPKKSVLGEWYGAEKDIQPVLMQFTGKYDKNGKEIYEGDILEVSYFTLGEEKRRTYRNIVKWSDAGMCWEYFGPEFPSFTSPEVVGNIYELPEETSTSKDPS